MSMETNSGAALIQSARRRQRMNQVRVRASEQTHDRMRFARRQLVSFVLQRHPKRGVDTNESL